MPELHKDIEDRIFSTFASVASSIGFSEVHGRILAALIVSKKPISLQELAKKTKYSAASISLSLDLLELVGLVRKIKNSGDRRLYVEMDGDMIEGLRRALMLKVQKSIALTLNDFDNYRKKSDTETKKIIDILEKEMKRLEKYINKVSEISI